MVRRAADDLIAVTAPGQGDDLTAVLTDSLGAYVDYVVANRPGYLSLVRAAAGGNEALRDLRGGPRLADGRMFERAGEHGISALGHEDTPAVRLMVRGWSALAESVVLDWSADQHGVTRDELLAALAASLFGARRRTLTGQEVAVRTARSTSSRALAVPPGAQPCSSSRHSAGTADAPQRAPSRPPAIAATVSVSWPIRTAAWSARGSVSGPSSGVPSTAAVAACRAVTVKPLGQTVPAGARPWPPPGRLQPPRPLRTPRAGEQVEAGGDVDAPVEHGHPHRLGPEHAGVAG